MGNAASSAVKESEKLFTVAIRGNYSWEVVDNFFRIITPNPKKMM
jgi:hypothetical protein